MKNNIEEIDDMIEFGGSYYLIDFEAFDTLIMLNPKKDEKHIETTTETQYKANHDGENVHIDTTKVTTREYDKQPEINAPTYDAVRYCLEILFTYNNEVDDTLGTDRALKGTNIPFKIAFNTLRSYGILKEIEIED